MADIDVGSAAIDRSSASTATYTGFYLDNPVNANGYITHIEIYVNTAITGAKVGFFRLVSGTTYRCIGIADLGSISTGLQEFDAPADFAQIAVEAGDFIGAYSSSGKMDIDTSGGSGVRYISGDHCVVDDESSYSFLGGRIASLYGEGFIPVSVTIEPPVATAAASANVPTPSLGVTLEPPVATASGQGQAPSLSLDRIFDAALATATAQAHIPTITAGTGVTIQPPIATASAQANIPAMSLGITVLPPAATASALAKIPTLTLGIVIIPPAAAASALAKIPTLSLGVTLEPPAALANAQALAPVFVIDILIEPPAATATAQANVPRILRMRFLTPVRTLTPVRELDPERTLEAS